MIPISTLHGISLSNLFVSFSPVRRYLLYSGFTIIINKKEIYDIDRSLIKKQDAFFSADDYELAMLESVNQNPEVAAQAAKYDAVIVLIKASDHNGKLIERALDILRIQEANVVGAILYDTNASLIKQYVFSPFCSPTKKLKEDIYNARNASDIVAPK